MNTNPNACAICGKLTCPGDLQDHPIRAFAFGLFAVAVVVKDELSDRIRDRWFSGKGGRR